MRGYGLEHLTVAESSARQLADYLRSLQNSIALATISGEIVAIGYLREQITAGIADCQRSIKDSLEMAYRTLGINIDDLRRKQMSLGEKVAQLKGGGGDAA